nr:DUF2589 domain-containing protein [uncultured Flavobacterium sp.]
MQSELLSIAQQFTGLPMDSLIGGPLNAAATANASMALTQTKFMLDTCFNKTTTKGSDGKDTSSYTPIMIKMSLTKGIITATYDDNGNATDAKVTPITTEFDLPMLTIVPLNSLAVQTVDINFDMEVKSSYDESQSDSTSTETKAEASIEAKLGWGILSVTVKGSASYDSKSTTQHDTHYQKSNSAKYTVNVHAGQLPLPKGVNTIIEAFTQTISPITLPAGTSGNKSGGGGTN